MLLPCVCPTDQERLDTLYSDTVAAITAHVEGRQPDPSLLLAPTTTQPGSNTTISSTQPTPAKRGLFHQAHTRLAHLAEAAAPRQPWTWCVTPQRTPSSCPRW